MKASDLDQVTTLLQDLSIARRNLLDYESIPAVHDNPIIRIGWKHDAPDTPDYLRHRSWTLNIDQGLDGENAVATFHDFIKLRLLNRINALRSKLQSLGVAPDA